MATRHRRQPLHRRWKSLLRRWMDDAYWAGRDAVRMMLGSDHPEPRKPTARLEMERLERREMPAGSFQLTLGSYGGTEGTNDVITFTVTFQGFGGGTVDYATSDNTPVSAAAGSDYVTRSGTLSFGGAVRKRSPSRSRTTRPSNRGNISLSS